MPGEMVEPALLPQLAHGRIDQRIARLTLFPGVEALLCGGVGVPVDVLTDRGRLFGEGRAMLPP